MKLLFWKYHSTFQWFPQIMEKILPTKSGEGSFILGWPEAKNSCLAVWTSGGVSDNTKWDSWTRIESEGHPGLRDGTNKNGLLRVSAGRHTYPRFANRVLNPIKGPSIIECRDFSTSRYSCPTIKDQLVSNMFRDEPDDCGDIFIAPLVSYVRSSH